jgi:NhaP-type Na+/H+ or K+/H+ antiporter
MGAQGDLDTLALVGITLVIAFLIGKLLSRFGIPQVVGYIIAGTLLGPSFVHIIPRELNDSLTFVTEVALGLIGFDMGGHLKLRELRLIGWSIVSIVVLEAVGAFVLVGLGVFLLTHRLATAIIFGALAAATDPASTCETLSEYDCEGRLTTTLRAVVGLDDAVALLLFSVGAALAETMLSNGGHVSLLEMLELPLRELAGSLVVGVALGLALSRTMKRFANTHDVMIIAMGAIFVCAGLSHTFDLSLVLTTMIMGAMVVNRDPEDGRYIRFTIEHVGPVIYVLFFALVGARLQISALPEMGLIGVVYLLLRNAGKYGGAWVGGTLGHAAPVVRDNVGLALFAQAGVVIGLALSAGERFDTLGVDGHDLADLVLNVITATTFIAQIIGPVMVKFAIQRAGEIHQAIGEFDDLVPGLGVVDPPAPDVQHAGSGAKIP